MLQTELTSEQVSIRLSDEIAARIAIPEAVRDLMRTGELDDAASFRKHVLALQGRFSGLLAVNWIDAQGVIRRVVPVAPNSRALGRNLRQHPVAGPLVRASSADGLDRFSPPLELFQGGQGFTGYLPVHRDGELIGLLNPVFRIGDLVEGVLSKGGLGDAYSVVVRDGRVIHEHTVPGATPTSISAQHPVPVGDRTWSVELRPGPELVSATRSSSLDLAALLALLASLTLSLLVRAQLRAAAERRVLVAQLEQRQRLETIGTLAGGVAHEYNNHLTALLGFVQIAQRALPSDTDTAADCLAQSEAVVQRSRQVVEQILTFARKHDHKVRAVRVAPVVQEVGRLFETTLTKAIRVTVDLGIDAAVTVMGDSGRIHQILTNLVTNASQALGGAGEITISAHPIEVDAARAGASPTLSPGPYVELAVRDNGPGIPQAVQDRMFEPFFTTKATGTGLGLSVTHGIVLDHNGELLVDSSSAGTTMRVLLPRSTDAPEEAEAPAPIATPEGARILLVEDDPMVQRMVRAILDEGGFRVETADSAEEAEALISTMPIDLLLTDDMLPGKSGIQFGEEMHLSHPALPVVLMSGCPPAGEEELLRRGFRAFVPKPFEVDGLLDTLQGLLEPKP